MSGVGSRWNLRGTPVGRVVLGCALLAAVDGTTPSSARPEASSGLGGEIPPPVVVGEAWSACDDLDPDRGFPAGSGGWVELGLTSWEAVPDAVQGRLRAGLEPPRGPGLCLDLTLLDGGTGVARSLAAAAIWRNERLRVEGILREDRFAGGRSISAGARILVVWDGRWAVGGTLQTVLGSPSGEPQILPEVRGGAGPFLVALTLRRRAEGVVGLRPRPGLTLVAGYDGGVPSLGFVIAPGGGQFRAEARDHPFLGRVARAAFRLGGTP